MKACYPERTRFARDIVTEFLPPSRPSRKVVILCTGMPNVPKHLESIMRFTKAGYWVFHPRYRGTWESGGSFLARSPHEDIEAIITGLVRGFAGVGYSVGKRWRIRPSAIHLVGGSFGGPAALLAGRDRRVTSVVTLSPVLDWRTMARTSEPLPHLKRLTRSGYGMGYRFRDRDWAKLAAGRFYNPMTAVSTIVGNKALILQAKDDPVVDWRTAQTFSERTGTRFVLSARGGHFSSSGIFDPGRWRLIRAFQRRFE